MASDKVTVNSGPATESQQSKSRLRWMIRRDMPEILHIENLSFKEPWSEKDFLHCLRQRNCIGMVAEVGEKVVAFFTYELHPSFYCLTNIAVHPEYRRQGIGASAILMLQGKLSSFNRTDIVALVPKSCLPVRAFFEKYGIAVRPTEQKGKLTCTPVLSAMDRKDVEDVQAMENKVLGQHDCEPRRIGDLLAKNSSYGIIARDTSGGGLLGYVLYERDSKGLSFNGEFGVIVGSSYRRRGIGRKLVEELVKQQLPITLYDVCLTCKDQCRFLRAVGVPVPKLNRFVTVEWNPRETAS